MTYTVLKVKLKHPKNKINIAESVAELVTDCLYYIIGQIILHYWYFTFISSQNTKFVHLKMFFICFRFSTWPLYCMLLAWPSMQVCNTPSTLQAVHPMVIGIG